MIGTYGSFGYIDPQQDPRSGQPADPYGINARVADARAAEGAVLQALFQAGADAYAAGVPLTSNPYRELRLNSDGSYSFGPDSGSFLQWKAGWQDAKARAGGGNGGGKKNKGPQVQLGGKNYVDNGNGTLTADDGSGGIDDPLPTGGASYDYMWAPIEDATELVADPATGRVTRRRKQRPAPSGYEIAPATAAGLGLGGALLIGGVLYMLFGGKR